MYDANEANVQHAKNLVADHRNSQEGFGRVTPDEIYIVWFCKTLQHWKALLSSDAWDDSSYYEVTFNGDKHEAYVDWYKKVSNTVMT